MHDGRDGVEEGERIFAGQCLNGGRERRRGQRAGGDDDAVPFGGRQACDLFARDGDQRFGFEGRLHRGRERHAVDGERAARRHFVRVARAHDERAAAAHLFVQQTDGVVLPIVGAERVRAHEFGEAFADMRLRHLHRPHLVQHDRHARARDLPGGFRPGEAAADDVNGLGRLMRSSAARQ